MVPADWRGVAHEIERIIANSVESFAPETIAQVNDVINLLRNRAPLPDVGKGYWSTISLAWSDDSLEIEIFEDRVEVYRFFDRRTDIKHIAHKPGDPFPVELLDELPTGSS